MTISVALAYPARRAAKDIPFSLVFVARRPEQGGTPGTGVPAGGKA